MGCCSFGGGDTWSGVTALRHLSAGPRRAQADAAARRAPNGVTELVDVGIPTHATGKPIELCQPDDLAHAVQLPELIIASV